LACVSLGGVLASSEDHGGEDLFDLSLEQLLKIKVPTSTLIPTEMWKEPGTVYTMNKKTISSSGARTLNELIEIHVPGTHFRTHISLNPHMAMRGIISDRDDKYLTIVDGVVVNDRFKAGSDTERDIPLLADIETVRVLLGPSSVLHGSGAIAGLIIIDTISARSSSGTQIKARGGVIEDFVSLEMNHTHQLAWNSGVLIHAGIVEYNGADQKDAPLFYSHSFVSATHGAVQPGEPVQWDIIDYNRSFKDRPKVKAQLHYYYGDLDARLRFISGGRSQDYNHIGIASYDKGAIDHGYQQWHASLNHEAELTKGLTLESGGTFLTHDNRVHRMYIDQTRANVDTGFRSYESHLIFKLLWRPSGPDAKHELAALVDLSYGDWGRKTEGKDDVAATNNFSTRTHSVALEHIWSPSDVLNVVSDIRVDKHTYTDYNTSYRVATNYRLGERDIVKLSYDNSYRIQSEQSMKSEVVLGREQEPEHASSITFSYLHDFDSPWSSQLTYFYYDHQFVGFDTTALKNHELGTFKHHGLELDFKASFSEGSFGINHSYTKLLSADLMDNTFSQSRSASPYGFGDDLVAMPNHITKLYGTYQMLERLSFNGSLRILFKAQGDEDLVAYYNTQVKQISPADPGETDFSMPSFFLNLGSSYQIKKGQELRVDIWNALGWVDDKYNKRNSVKRVATYRYEPAAVGMSLDLKF
jgi:outer membrane receptor for ferrienterochelin and colicin